MLTLIILFVLFFGFYSGARRGLLLQGIYTFGYLIAYLIAKSNYKKLGSFLEMYIPYPAATSETKLVLFNQDIVLDLDQAFYAAIAFLLIVFTGWIVVRFIGLFARGLSSIPVFKEANWLAGGIFGFLVVYVALFLILTTLAMIPVDAIQNQFEKSGFARFMVESTPIFSKQIKDLWITQIIK